MDGVRIELADPEGQLLEEIANPVMTRHDVRLTYRLALRSQDRVDWGEVNRAIIERWSLTTLKQIKAWAWKGHEVTQVRAGDCSLCGGSGWIPGVAWPVGPLDELPCPDCSASSPNRKTET